MKLTNLVASINERYYLWAISLFSICLTLFVTINYSGLLIITLAMLVSCAAISICIVRTRITKGPRKEPSLAGQKKMTFINVLASVYYSAISALIAISTTLFIALTSSSLLLLVSMILASCAAITEYVMDAVFDKAQRSEHLTSRNRPDRENRVSHTSQSDETVKQKPMTFIDVLASINETYFLGFLAVFCGIITISVVRMSSNLLVIAVMILVVCYFIAACAASAALRKTQCRNR